MKYTVENVNGIYRLTIPTDSEWGTICFNWDDSEDYLVFRQRLEVKGIDAFVDLLIQDSNTAFNTFVNG